MASKKAAVSWRRLKETEIEVNCGKQSKMERERESERENENGNESGRGKVGRVSCAKLARKFGRVVGNNLAAR